MQKLNINIDSNEFTHTSEIFDYNLEGSASEALESIQKIFLKVIYQKSERILNYLDIYL